MTPDVESVFLDTNVLVYANVAESPFHALALSRIERMYQDGVDLWISRQVLREYLAVLTRLRRSAEALSTRVLAERVRFFATHFRVANEDQVVTDRLLELVERFSVVGRQVHDANIVATMLACSVGCLLTANEQDFTQYSSLIVVEPLRRHASA